MKLQRNTYQLTISAALCTFGCALLLAGFIIAPSGEIHNSVLIAFGEIMTFVGALLGIDYKYRSRK